MSSPRSSGRRVWSLVRAPIWWTPKVLPVIAAAALAAIAADVSAGEGLPRVIAMVVSAVGVAAFAHVVNDLADREVDRIAGKRNALSNSPGWMPWALMSACGVLAITPWIFVSIGIPAAVVLATLVLTSIAYSVPPVRLKRRGLLGAVADAAVAHVLPTVFAFMLMGSAGSRTTAWWVATVGATVWALGFGIRSIVVHQILDMDSDDRASVETFVVQRGTHRSARTARDAFSLELLGLGLLAFVTVWVAWGAAIYFAVHLSLWLNHRRWERQPIDTVPTRHGQWMPLAEFYEVWPAIALCGVLVVEDLRWAWLLGALIVIFWSAVEKQLLDQLTMLVELASWIVDVLGPILERLGIRTGMTSRSAWGRIVTFGWAIRSGMNRCYHAIRIALREFGFKLGRTWWSIFRAHWRVRHWFGPLVRLVRRQKRRAKRILGRGDQPGNLPG
ncbi:MAG: UbiA family prenyltransferase [Microthrixaceae bacterium]